MVTYGYEPSVPQGKTIFATKIRTAGHLCNLNTGFSSFKDSLFTKTSIPKSLPQDYLLKLLITYINWCISP